MQQRSRLNRAYWSRVYRIRAFRRKAHKEAYARRCNGDRIKCLRCKASLPKSSYKMKVSGEAPKRCIPCDATYNALIKKRTSPKKKCARNSCEAMVYKKNKIKYCRACFARMGSAGRNRAMGLH